MTTSNRNVRRHTVWSRSDAQNIRHNDSTFQHLSGLAVIHFSRSEQSQLHITGGYSSAPNSNFIIAGAYDQHHESSAVHQSPSSRSQRRHARLNDSAHDTRSAARLANRPAALHAHYVLISGNRRRGRLERRPAAIDNEAYAGWNHPRLAFTN